jgi:hypothetical protein
MIAAVMYVVIVVCGTVLALAFYKGDVSATLKCFGIGLVLEVKDRKAK